MFYVRHWIPKYVVIRSHILCDWQLEPFFDALTSLTPCHCIHPTLVSPKPVNIGFDTNGVLKLFDFGLAKELDTRQKNATGLYEMSGGTGSRRYMAPEVARSEPYHLSADMYSFAIVLWEVLCFEKAYWEMTLDEHKETVLDGEERPKVVLKWSMSLQSLFQACWHKDATIRPSAKRVQKMLQQELESFSSQHKIRLHRSRRASM